jgi:hypothetical protein
MLDPNLFHFDYRDERDALVVNATNGPIVIQFVVTESGVQYRALGSNVKLIPEIAAVSLAAARFVRRNPAVLH